MPSKDSNDSSLSESFHEITKNSHGSGQSLANDMNTHPSAQSTNDRQMQKEASRTITLDRTNDHVYSATTKVVKAIMSLSHGVEKAAAIEYLELVRHVGIELRALLSSVDTLASIFPPHALKYVLFNDLKVL